MTKGFARFQQSRHLHFVTFSCYRRQAYLQSDESKRIYVL